MELCAFSYEFYDLQGSYVFDAIGKDAASICDKIKIFKASQSGHRTRAKSVLITVTKMNHLGKTILPCVKEQCEKRISSFSYYIRALLNEAIDIEDDILALTDRISRFRVLYYF